MKNKLFNSVFRNAYICDSLDLWEQLENKYESSLDVIFTFDFALVDKIKKCGGEAFYIDHLVSPEMMHKENFLIYKFFEQWHLDSDGKDLFNYKDTDFGLSFRLEYWNDFTYFIRLYLNVSLLENVKLSGIFVNSSDDVLIGVLDELGIVYSSLNVMIKNPNEISKFYFPISKWMKDRVRPAGVRLFLYTIRALVNYIFGISMLYWDKAFSSTKKTIFIQEYHPTKEIINKLKADADVRVVLSNLPRSFSLTNLFAVRVLPISIYSRSKKKDAEMILENYHSKKCAKLILLDGRDITSLVYKIIDSHVFSCIEEYLSILNCCLKYVENNHVDLEVLISNIGKNVTLFDCACKKHHIPSFLIINGLLGPEYSDESKYAGYINCYSESIKRFYYDDSVNVYPLGDPRMDMYFGETNNINRSEPVIVIGTSGFNNVDLNSYVAVEFDFLFDVLTAIVKSGINSEVIIKTRPNGYALQYQCFVDKYFPALACSIVASIPMYEVLKTADLYISIYSQTLFEASVLGVPVIYYKKDTETMCPPFDSKSELTTVASVQELVMAIHDYQLNNARFEPFLSKKNMEKYVGFLDGRNLERNLDFIYNILESKNDNS